MRNALERSFICYLCTQGGCPSRLDTSKNQFKCELQLIFNSYGCIELNFRVVGGLETLDKMEKVKTDDKDRPLVCIECNFDLYSIIQVRIIFFFSFEIY